MKAVYIASPYTIGDQMENVKNQIRCADFLVLCGYLPFWPLSSHFWHTLRPRPWEFWMKLDLEWILRCDALLRLPGESKGADREVGFAKEHNIPVFTNIDELDRHFGIQVHFDVEIKE